MKQRKNYRRADSAARDRIDHRAGSVLGRLAVRPATIPCPWPPLRLAAVSGRGEDSILPKRKMSASISRPRRPSRA